MAKNTTRYSKMPPLAVVRADLSAGLTNAQMEAKYKVGRSTLTGFLTRHGIRRKPRAFIPADADIVACLRMGMNYRQIAAKLGGHPDTLGRHIRAARLRDEIPAPQPLEIDVPVGPQPSPTKFVNTRGVSVPRIPTIHRRFEARP